MINAKIPGETLAIGFLLAVLFPLQSFAGADSQVISFNDGRTYGSVLQIFDASADAGRDQQFGSDSILKSVAYNEFSINRRTHAGELHIGNASADGETLNQVGFSFSRLRVDAFNGYGKSASGIRNPYSVMDANLFHPGANQRFEYSGFSVDSEIYRNLNFNFTHAKIVSAGLKDRVVHGIGLSTRNVDLTVMEVQRGVDRVGSVYSLSTQYSQHQLGFDYLKRDSGASYQAFSYSRDHKGIRYKFGFVKTDNPLYSAKNENRAIFSVGFGFGNRGGRFYATEEGQPATGGNARNGYLIGAGAVGAAVALSSGSDSADNLVRSPTQHAAARRVLNEINPVSVKENREYGGYVFRNQDGSYSSTSPIRGEAASLLLPLPDQIVATGSVGTATYHTHAAFDPRYDNENFSTSDIAADQFFGLDGYLGTPAGAFKYHELSTGMIITLGKIAN